MPKTKLPIDRLLNHLNAGKKLLDFPTIKPVRSLDYLEDGMTLVLNPNDHTVNVIENVNTHFPTISHVSQSLILNDASYNLKYSVGKAQLILDRRSGMTGVTDKEIKEQKVYSI